MGRPRREVAGNEMGKQIFHKTWDFQDAVPSFERDDKQRDDKCRKTEGNGVNLGGNENGHSSIGKKHKRIRNGWGESKVEKCLLCPVRMHR